MKPNKYPLSRKENIVVQELDGEVLIYDLSENKAFCLNETSALVWAMCDGNKSISEISEGLGKKLNSKASEDLVWLALDQLKKEKLIANSEEIAYDFNGMSRRDVIKKVGLGTMIALPIVTGLIAPTAAHAQSASACRNACSCSATNGTNANQTCTAIGGTIQTGCGSPNSGGTGVPAGCTCNNIPPGSNNGTCVLAAAPVPPAASVCTGTCQCSAVNGTSGTVNCTSVQGGAFIQTGCGSPRSGGSGIPAGCTCQVNPNSANGTCSQA